ncbi:MAG: Kelch repeat-containing protein [Polyangiales bacterium]
MRGLAIAALCAAACAVDRAEAPPSRPALLPLVRDGVVSAPRLEGLRAIIGEAPGVSIARRGAATVLALTDAFGETDVEVSPEDALASSSAPRVEERAVRIAGVARATDHWIVAGVLGTRFVVEDAHVLRDATAPRTFHYDVRGSRVLSQTTGGTLEVRDGAGALRWQIDPPFAMDAAGKRVPLRVSIREHGFDLALEDRNLAYPVTVDPTWTSTAPMSSARALHTATELADGRVLVAGGIYERTVSLSSVRSTAEIFDPKTGAWKPAASFDVPRYLHTATRLPSGKVLVVGGYEIASPTTTIYDPTIDKWRSGPASSNYRVGSAACALADGTVLVSGGGQFTLFGDASPTASIEVYDEKTDAFTKGPPMSMPRLGHTATRLADGRVLVAGGGTSPGNASKDAEIYDPVAKKWTAVPSMSVARSAHTATLLVDGRVLVVGGAPAGFLGTTSTETSELFDPATSTWSAGPSMSAQRALHTAVRLPSGRVLVAGGAPASLLDAKQHSTAELFDPAGMRWISRAPMSIARTGHTATWAGERMIVTGGTEGIGVLSSAEMMEANPVGSACKIGEKCETGFCVDGVCCDSPCAGACESCVGAVKGQCAPLTGLPKPGHQTCGGYLCTAEGCATSCATDADCDPAFACTAGKCVGREHKAACSSDGLDTIDTSGQRRSCGAYRCGSDGNCESACSSSDQCAPGFACDEATHSCTTAPQPDSGGCSIRTRARADGGAPFAGLLLLYVAATLRARASRRRGIRDFERAQRG